MFEDRATQPVHITLIADQIISVANEWYNFYGTSVFNFGKIVTLYGLVFVGHKINTHVNATARSVKGTSNKTLVSLKLSKLGELQLNLFGSDKKLRFTEPDMNPILWPCGLEIDQIELSNNRLDNFTFLEGYASFTTIDTIELFFVAYIKPPQLLDY